MTTLAVCLQLVLVVLPAGSAEARDGTGWLAGDARYPLAREEWAALALERCRDDREARDAADALLAARLASKPLSRDQAAFPADEAKARARAETRARRDAIARLDALLSGGRARFPDPDSGKRDAFLDVLGILLRRENVCAIEAVEGAVLFAIFGVLFDADAARALRPDRASAHVDARLREHASGGSLETAFHAMRGRSADALPYVEAVIRRSRALGATTAEGEPNEAVAEHRLRQFLELVTYAAEPVRIRHYLHARIDQLEGVLGTTLPEPAKERLFVRAELALFRSIDAMRRLRGLPPGAVLDALTGVLDRWFQTDAIPALRKALAADPFGAYWFFVRSGGVISRERVSDGSRVAASDAAFALAEIGSLALGAALERIEASRVPADFLDRHAALERVFTQVSLSAEEALARLEHTRVRAPVKTRFRAFLLAGGETSRLSTVDVYSRLILDASRISGRLDRPLVAAAMEMLRAEKTVRLAEEIERTIAASPSPHPGLEGYLRTAAALMVELEHRQAVEPGLQQGTSGAAVGWLLSQFFIAGTVPATIWAPGGVNGAEFAELIDALTPKNRDSGNVYAGKAAASLELLHDGAEYHEALVALIDGASNFLNVAAFDWKTDAGGRDIAYRLMAKKLGVDGDAYGRFLATFDRGLPLEPSDPAIVAFYDIPTTRLKDLLVWYFVETSDHPQVAAARDLARRGGASLECATVRTCGDLEGLRAHAGARYDPRHPSPAHHDAWRAYAALDALFSDRPPGLSEVRPRRALRDYCEDPASLRRLVRRAGLRRADGSGTAFDINIVADGKQNLSNIRFGERSEQFPYFVTEPIRDIYLPLLEFDIRVMLWKGAMEFPWRLGPVPVGGRRLLGIVPMPFIPWPWLHAVPGFGWAGPITSVLLQYLLATDVRIWWASVSHTKSWSSESAALESGMGMGTKYYNEHDTHRTWHDVGVVVRGAPVADVNDHFVQVFNEVRRNNTGLPSSRGVSIPKLRYEDYAGVERAVEDDRGGSRTWLVTTHPEQGDLSYRGALVAALAAAQRSIYIENPFFSDPLVARLLIRKAREFRARVRCDAASSHECATRMREAVQIYLVLPDSSDKPVVDAIGTADFREMLHLGIKVHRWRPERGWSATSMLHSKVWLVDYDPEGGGLAYVGAANATQRSHIADNEAGILSDDPRFTKQVYERVFLPDITADSRVESGEMFHITRSSQSALRASRWLRRLLVELFWFV